MNQDTLIMSVCKFIFYSHSVKPSFLSLCFVWSTSSLTNLSMEFCLWNKILFWLQLRSPSHFQSSPSCFSPSTTPSPCHSESILSWVKSAFQCWGLAEFNCRPLFLKAPFTSWGIVIAVLGDLITAYPDELVHLVYGIDFHWSGPGGILPQTNPQLFPLGSIREAFIVHEWSAVLNSFH